jgi:hypothetical protein
MQGMILVFTRFVTGSSLVGGIFSQTPVNFQMATITQAETSIQAAATVPQSTATVPQAVVE